MLYPSNETGPSRMPEKADETHCPDRMLRADPDQGCKTGAAVDVGLIPTGRAIAFFRGCLTDEQLESVIGTYARLEASARARFERWHCFGDCGEADRWKTLRELAIATRSPAREEGSNHGA